MSGNIILLAISGGIDSMVMLHRMLDIHGSDALAVAHCNFQLRGTESDEDERFVQDTCERMGVPFWSRCFQTRDYASEHGLSIQEAARNLRYSWFFQLMTEHNYSFLATAHQMDDSIETFFINLLRGSGPQGLSGIQEDEQRLIIRPIMDMGRHDVLEYAETHGIIWREDSSNASTAYLRNAIRHDIIPRMESLRPGFKKVMQRNMGYQKALSSLLDKATERYRNQYFLIDGDTTRIGVEGGDTDHLILSHALRPYGFTSDQVENLLNTTESGKQVHSTTHIITTHRGDFLLSPCRSSPEGPWRLTHELNCSALPFDLEAIHMEVSPIDLDPDKQLAYLDVNALKFPLTIRKWKEGDRFRPLGMKGSKLVSDLLNDQKVPIQEKDRTYVLLSGDQIAWVIGRRISEDFKSKRGQPCILWRYTAPDYI